jgi:hypothetical protein
MLKLVLCMETLLHSKELCSSDTCAVCETNIDLSFWLVLVILDCPSSPPAGILEQLLKGKIPLGFLA